MRVAINTCYGGFGLSTKAHLLYCKKKYGEAYLYKKENNQYQKVANDYIPQEALEDLYITFKDLGDDIIYDFEDIEDYVVWEYEICSSNNRTDPILIDVIIELGHEADGDYASLKIVDVPDDIEWYIDDYDGRESINEKHRSWS